MMSSLAVAVDVGDAEAVVALAAIGAVAGRAVVAVERPAPGQLAVAPVPGGQHGARVVAAAHDDARPLAVEIGDAGEEAIDAVAVVVAPGGDLAARREVVGRGQRRAGRAVEDGEELRARRERSRRCCGGRPWRRRSTLPAPSIVPSAVLQTTSAWPSPSRS